MAVLLYWSGDNGQLYQGHEIDDPADDMMYQVWSVPDRVTFTPAQLCVQDGSILEALVSTGQATLVRDFAPPT